MWQHSNDLCTWTDRRESALFSATSVIFLYSAYHSFCRCNYAMCVVLLNSMHLSQQLQCVISYRIEHYGFVVCISFCVLCWFSVQRLDSGRNWIVVDFGLLYQLMMIFRSLCVNRCIMFTYLYCAAGCHRHHRCSHLSRGSIIGDLWLASPSESVRYSKKHNFWCTIVYPVNIILWTHILLHYMKHVYKGITLMVC